MKHPFNPRWLALPVALLLAGCSTPDKMPAQHQAFATPTDLAANPTNGNNVIVRWHNSATADGGVWVEYTTPGDEYIQLDAFPSDSGESSFVHPNVPPQTIFIYRLKPFFGRPTKPIAITTGTPATNDIALGAGPIDPTNNVAFDQHRKYSIRNVATFAEAMPSALVATLSSPTSVDLRWKDHASDEEGYLLEISADPTEAFVPCALLPPDTTSFRKTLLPPRVKCYFRVRAFFYGKPTQPVSVKTG